MISRINSFLNKEFAHDALRNILVIMLPAILLYYTVGIEAAIPYAVGVILASLTDLPGNRKDKKLTAIWCIALFAITSFATTMALHYLPWSILFILGIWGLLCTFMIAFGPRWGAIGNLTLIVISFTIGLKPQDPIGFSSFFMLGTISFFTISLAQVYVSPYRSLKYAMQDGFAQMATLLETKIKCYDENADLEKTYRELSILHIKISEQLENIRSLLLREKSLIHSSNNNDLIWLNKIYRLIDLYELLMGVDSDYEIIREKLKNTTILANIRETLQSLAHAIRAIEHNHQGNQQLIQQGITGLELALQHTTAENRAIIHPILAHVKYIAKIVQEVQQSNIAPDPTWVSAMAYKNFVATPSKGQIIRKHLKSKSPILTYALRMSTLLLAAGLIGYLLPEYRYASWMILTIILVARPSYINTQKRNYERIVGSLIGIMLSLLILLFLKNTTVLFVITGLMLYAFFLFNKPNYLVCVIFITVAAIVFLHLYEGSIWDLLGSRLAFTLAGSILALLGYFALPINHQRTMNSLSHTLITNYHNYYHKLRERLSENSMDPQELRLARKHAQTSLAQLYDNLDQFQKEPRYKKMDWTDVMSFQTLAYRINALLVGVSISITKSAEDKNDAVVLERLNGIEHLLLELHQLGQSERISSRA